MGNMLDYMGQWGGFSLSERPFNEVDSLVLCQLIYLNYGRFVPGMEADGESVSIQEIYENPEREHILDDYWYREESKRLFALTAQSVRFRDLKMNYYVNVISQEEQTQFSAMTYFLEDGTVYLAYRGTDANIVGWKEDLNLAFSKPTYGQQLAVDYMEQVVQRIRQQGKKGIYCGGHSKGGNLAVYAAMNCRPDTRARLIGVFSNDGPGFRPEIISRGQYEEIKDRLHKFIPQSSIVGTMLEEQRDFELIESAGYGFLQHNTYTWSVEDGAFVRVSNMSAKKSRMDAAFNQWVLSLTEEELHTFVDTLYEVIEASEASNVFEFEADWKNCLQNILEAAKGVDEDTKRMISRIIHTLFELFREKRREEVSEKARELLEDVKEKQQKEMAKRRKKEKNS